MRRGTHLFPLPVQGCPPEMLTSFQRDVLVISSVTELYTIAACSLILYINLEVIRICIGYVNKHPKDKSLAHLSRKVTLHGEICTHVKNVAQGEMFMSLSVPISSTGFICKSRSQQRWESSHGTILMKEHGYLGLLLEWCHTAPVLRIFLEVLFKIILGESEWGSAREVGNICDRMEWYDREKSCYYSEGNSHGFCYLICFINVFSGFVILPGLASSVKLLSYIGL